MNILSTSHLYPRNNYGWKCTLHTHQSSTRPCTALSRLWRFVKPRAHRKIFLHDCCKKLCKPHVIFEWKVRERVLMRGKNIIKPSWSIKRWCKGDFELGVFRAWWWLDELRKSWHHTLRWWIQLLLDVLLHIFNATQSNWSVPVFNDGYRQCYKL